MFGLSHHQRFFLFSQAVDMRKGFDGLSGLVQQQMGKDSCSGDVHIFLGKRLDRMNRTADAAFGLGAEWFYFVQQKIRGRNFQIAKGTRSIH